MKNNTTKPSESENFDKFEEIGVYKCGCFAESMVINREELEVVLCEPASPLHVNLKGLL